MPRQARFCPAGFPVHVVHRGNNRQAIFTSDDDLAGTDCRGGKRRVAGEDSTLLPYGTGAGHGSISGAGKTTSQLSWFEWFILSLYCDTNDQMTSLELLGLLFITALLVGLIGFIRTVWFISIGYTASIVAFVVVSGVVVGAELGAVVVAQLLTLLAWGLRLGFYLAVRERNAAYQSTIKDQTDRSQSLPLIVKVGIWISVALLYVCMFAPAVFLAEAVSGLSKGQLLLSAAGLGIMWLGLAIETMADHQKSKLKAANPDSFASAGLYGWVRYPNYLGEILFWLGNFLAGIVAYNAWWQWVITLAGVICIILIMMGSTKRLELKQNDRYGEDQDYQEYVRSVPVLFPWLPIYTFKNLRVYLG